MGSAFVDLSALMSTAHGSLVLSSSTAPTTALTMAESGVAP